MNCLISKNYVGWKTIVQKQQRLFQYISFIKERNRDILLMSETIFGFFSHRSCFEKKEQAIKMNCNHCLYVFEFFCR